MDISNVLYHVFRLNRKIGGVNVSISALETEVGTSGVHQGVTNIEIDQTADLKLRCVAKSVIRNRKTYWHKCSWTEFVGKKLETTSRTCLTDYVENSTHSNGNKVVNCTTPDPNGISVYADGENSCVLDVASANHLRIDEWTEWKCTLQQCVSQDCLEHESCKTTSAIHVYVWNF